jgi:hypothetical protein
MPDIYHFMCDDLQNMTTISGGECSKIEKAG